MDAEALPLAEAEGCALAVGGWALADAAALGSAVGSVPESADGSVLVLTDDANGKLLRLTPGASASP